MTDLTDLLPLTTETPETIKARLLADVNAGIDPTDPMYLDTVPGAFWDDLMGAASLEFDRLYDRMHSEVPAAALPATTAGEWLDAWANSVGLERKDETAAAGVVEFTAPPTTAIATGTQVSTVQTAADTDPIVFETTEGGVVDGSGVLALPVQAIAPGAEGNVPANTVTVIASTIAAGATATNPNAITGGSDVETDEALQARLMAKLSGAGGGGNVDWYIAEALAVPGVGFVTVFANTPANGNVTVRITDVNNDPAPSELVAIVQQKFDPSSDPGQGAGEAPPGAIVHVDTPAATDVTVDATVALATGYSLDGAGGTRATGPAITAAVARYGNGRPVGGDVVHNKVLAAIIDVEGVDDVTALTLNGAGGDVAIDDTHVASIAATNLTEA